MEEAPKKKRAYTKSRLIKELAFRSGISQRQSRAALEAIIEIAYREAKANYFILPGLCKFDVVRRAPRNVRNPITGEQLVLPERDALHVVLSKRAKETVAPKVTPLKLEEYEALMAKKAEEEKAAAAVAAAAVETPAAPAESPAAEAAAAAPEETPQAVAEPPAEEASAAPEEAAQAEEETASDMPTLAEAAAAKAEERAGFVDAPEVKGNLAVSFRCTTCGQEIVAPVETVGYEAECPACGAILVVPAKSEPGTTYAPGGEGEKKEIISAEEVEDLDPVALKNRTIRIDTMLFGDDENKPAAEESAISAEAQKSRTMRIDLPDEF